MAEFTAAQAAEGVQNLAKAYRSVLVMADVLKNIGDLELAATQAAEQMGAARTQRDLVLAEMQATKDAITAIKEQYAAEMVRLKDVQDQVGTALIKADDQAGEIYQAAQLKASEIVTAAHREAQAVRDASAKEAAELKAVIVSLEDERKNAAQRLATLQAEIDEIRALFK